MFELHSYDKTERKYKLRQQGTTYVCWWVDDDENFRFKLEGNVEVGMRVKIGSPLSNDWTKAPQFETNEIIEVVKDEGDTVVFRTNNIRYKLKRLTSQ